MNRSRFLHYLNKYRMTKSELEELLRDNFGFQELRVLPDNVPMPKRKVLLESKVKDLVLHEDQIQYLEQRFNLPRSRIERMLWHKGLIRLVLVPDDEPSDILLADVTRN